MWKWTKLFRSPEEVAALRTYLVDDVLKEHILECFETGFVSHFEYRVPVPFGHVVNYEPLTSNSGREALTNAMKAQVVQGKMIGGPG